MLLLFSDNDLHAGRQVLLLFSDDDLRPGSQVSRMLFWVIELLPRKQVRMLFLICMLGGKCSILFSDNDLYAGRRVSGMLFCVIECFLGSKYECCF